MTRAPALLALALSLPLVLAGAPAARAQDVWGWSIIIPSLAGTDILGQHLRQRMQQQQPQPQPATPSSPPAPRASPNAGAAALRFTPSTQARAANFARFLAQRRAGADPATLSQLEALLADPQLMSKIAGQLRPYGLRTDDMADAYAVWWIQAWQTTRGLTDDPTPAAVRAVQAQARDAMLATPALLAATDADKQAFAEGLLIQSATLAAATEQVGADPAQQRGLAQVVKRSGQAVGLDLERMTLTDGGFVGG